MIDLSLPGGMEALVRGWELLQPQATLPTQGADFIAALGRTLLADTPIKLVEAKDDDETVAVLPLCHGRGPFARWRLPGAAEVFEPGDALCRDSGSAATLARFLARQTRPVELHRVPADSALIPALRSSMRGRGWMSVRPATACPFIPLDVSWTDAESRFSSRRRSDFRRAERRAAEFGQVTCEVLTPLPADFDPLFDEAVAVEARSWKTPAGTAIACDQAKEQFFRSYFLAACKRGEFRVAFLRIDGKAVAMQHAVEWSGRYWLYKIGYDEAYGRCSPGTLLMLHCLGHAARRGLESFELLGDAEAWIADFWTREQHECRRVRTYPLSLSGLTALLADGTAWILGQIRGQIGGRLRPSSA
jgi:CelD/BcsL family acetyltransferase involved in cellulose biosynthesis